MLESTSATTHLQEQLRAVHAEMKESAARESAVRTERDRLGAQVVELRAQLDTAAADRAHGVRQVASLARAVALADNRATEREATIASLRAELENAGAAELAVFIFDGTEPDTLDPV